MDLAGWLRTSSGCIRSTIALGLDRVRAVRDAARDPEVLSDLTVGGTNGKGSACAMLEAILGAAGYRVGCYTSPHLLRYNERVRDRGARGGRRSARRAFARGRGGAGRDAAHLFRVRHARGAWVRSRAPGLDAAVLEVGLGGRLDAVNAFEPIARCVTSVDLDHMDYLGDTRERSAARRRGIFRAGRPAIFADPNPPRACSTMRATIGAELLLIGRDFGYDAEARQWRYLGPRRRARRARATRRCAARSSSRNAACAIAALESLRERLPVARRRHPHRARARRDPGPLPGAAGPAGGDPRRRAQSPGGARARREPGAHGTAPAHARRVRDAARQGHRRRDRGGDAGASIAGTSPASTIPRGATAADARARYRGDERGRRRRVQFPTPDAALAAAREDAGGDDRIVVFGSFYTVAE